MEEFEAILSFRNLNKLPFPHELMGYLGESREVFLFRATLSSKDLLFVHQNAHLLVGLAMNRRGESQFMIEMKDA